VAPQPEHVGSVRVAVNVPPQQLDVDSMFHGGQVSLLVEGQVVPRILHAGSTATVKLGTVSQSTVQIKAVEVRLTERVTYVAGVRHESKRTLEYTRGSAEQAGFMEKKAGTAKLPAVRIIVLADARNSYQGRGLIEVRHDLCVKLVTASGTSNPKLKVPVQVVNPAPNPSHCDG
jgi:hypothetical protein